MNKLMSLVILGLSTLVLMGCEKTNGDTARSETTAIVQEGMLTGEEIDGLDEIGQSNFSQGAKVNLVNIAQIKGEKLITDELAIEDIMVKIIKFDDIEDDYLDLYENMGISIGDHIIQLTYNLQNNSTYSIENINFPHALTSKDEQITFNNSFGDYDALPGALVIGTGSYSKIIDPDIDSLEIDWEIYQLADEITPVKTQTVEVNF